MRGLNGRTYVKSKAFLLVLLFFLGRGEAANLHVLMVCDTNDHKIGQSIQIDIGRMKKQFKSIEKNTGLHLNLFLFQGSAAKPKEIIATLDSLDVEKDDVILFYFAGHGFRVEKKKTLCLFYILG